MQAKPLISRSGSTYEVLGITVDEAVTLLQNEIRFVDVRDRKDFEMTAVDFPGIENIPLLDLLHQLDTLDKRASYLFIDMDGTLAWKATNMLLYNDFDQAVFLAGGLLQWKSAGHPVQGRIPDIIRECGENSCSGCSCTSGC